MFSMIQEDWYEDLKAKIRGRIPGFQVKFKSESLSQKIIGKLLFFSPAYMTSYTSTFGRTVYFPSREYVQKENKYLAFKILAHEYVHLLDRKKRPLVFEFMYLFPQILALLSLLALLSIWFSNWWLVSLACLVAALPFPAIGRAQIEMRGYAMNMAIHIWKHGHLTSEYIDGTISHFSSMGYYRMWPYEGDVRKWILDWQTLTRNIEMVPERENLFQHSPAYADVYEIVKGVDLI